MLFDEYNVYVDSLSYEIKEKLQSIQPKRLHTDVFHSIKIERKHFPSLLLKKIEFYLCGLMEK